MNFTIKEVRSFAVDFAYYIHLNKLGDLSHEKHKELFDDWVKSKLPEDDVVEKVCEHKNKIGGGTYSRCLDCHSIVINNI